MISARAGSSTRLVLAILLFALALGAPVALSAAPRQEDPPPPPEKVRFQLQATPRHGFEPLNVMLYARLEGVTPGETRFCHAGVEWIGETRSGRVMRSTEDARCIHPSELLRVDHSFSKPLHIDVPAIYRYHVVLHLKDGSEVRSNDVEVRVIATH